MNLIKRIVVIQIKVIDIEKKAEVHSLHSLLIKKNSFLPPENFHSLCPKMVLLVQFILMKMPIIVTSVTEPKENSSLGMMMELDLEEILQ